MRSHLDRFLLALPSSCWMSGWLAGIPLWSKFYIYNFWCVLEGLKGNLSRTKEPVFVPLDKAQGVPLTSKQLHTSDPADEGCNAYGGGEAANYVTCGHLLGWLFVHGYACIHALGSSAPFVSTILPFNKVAVIRRALDFSVFIYTCPVELLPSVPWADRWCNVPMVWKKCLLTVLVELSRWEPDIVCGEWAGLNLSTCMPIIGHFTQWRVSGYFQDILFPWTCFIVFQWLVYLHCTDLCHKLKLEIKFFWHCVFYLIRAFQRGDWLIWLQVSINWWDIKWKPDGGSNHLLFYAIPTNIFTPVTVTLFHGPTFQEVPPVSTLLSGQSRHVPISR